MSNSKKQIAVLPTQLERHADTAHEVADLAEMLDYRLHHFTFMAADPEDFAFVETLVGELRKYTLEMKITANALAAKVAA